MRIGRFVLGLVLALGLPCLATLAQAADVPPDVYGAWALTTGARNLAVLVLRPGNAPNLAVSGDIAKPQTMSMTGNVVFNVEGPTADSAIVESRYDEAGLHFTTTSQSHPDEKFVYDFVVLNKDSASLSLEGSGMTLYLRRSGADALVAQDWDKNARYAIDESAAPEIKRLFDADQADRQAQPIDWKVVDKRDADRREATRKLLADGALHTGEDFENASFIFQHGEAADDYLLAHTLAVIAVNKGDKGAVWMAAATLDRYLMAIGQPQIYGTQFSLSAWSAECKATSKCRPKPAHLEQDPYNRALISDALRKAMDVPSQAKQVEQAESYKTSH